MSIDSINYANILSTNFDQIKALISQKSGSSSTLSAAGYSASDTSSISTPAEIFSKLASLQKSDPDQFTELVSSIADQLEENVNEADTSFSGVMLKDLAQKFRSVADGGSLSQLLPPSPPNLFQMSGGTSQSLIDQYTQTGQDTETNLFFSQLGQSQSNSSLEELYASISNQVLAA